MRKAADLRIWVDMLRENAKAACWAEQIGKRLGSKQVPSQIAKQERELRRRVVEAVAFRRSSDSETVPATSKTQSGDVHGWKAVNLPWTARPAPLMLPACSTSAFPIVLGVRSQRRIALLVASDGTKNRSPDFTKHNFTLVGTVVLLKNK